jgi:hypothetical protein
MYIYNVYIYMYVYIYNWDIYCIYLYIYNLPRSIEHLGCCPRMEVQAMTLWQFSWWKVMTNHEMEWGTVPDFRRSHIFGKTFEDMF